MKVMHKQSSVQRYLVGFVLILLMVGSATVLQDSEVILPEIGALTAGTWIYRKSTWIQQPAKLFLAPSGTAVIGFGINRLPVSYPVKVLLGLLLMLLFLRVIRSDLAPAFATGLLPIIINATHWIFIVAIFFWTLVLMLGVRWQQPQRSKVTTGVAIRPRQMLGFSGLVIAWVTLIWLAGYPQMAAIPPVIVVFFEAAQQPHYQAKTAVKQWLALTGAATIGVGIHLVIASWLVTILLALPLVFGLLHLLKLKLPAAYAFPLLALVLPAEMFSTLPLAAGLAAGFFLGGLLLYHGLAAPRQVSVADDDLKS